MQIRPDFPTLLPRLIYGYAFWTVFCALPPMIWFYPLNLLELSGYEVFVSVLISPIFLKLRPLISMLRRNGKVAETTLRALVVCSLLSFQAPSAFWRLSLLAAGSFFAVLQLAVDFTTDGGDQEKSIADQKKSINDQGANDQGKSIIDRHIRKLSIFYGYTGGYLALLASRVAYKTITPAYNDGGTNICIFVVALLSLLYQQFSSSSIDISNRTNDIPNGNNDISADNTSSAKKTIPEKPVPQRYWLHGTGFGSLLYVMLAVFGEISVPFRWIVAPYPQTGPDPTPYALLILLCLILGLWLGVEFDHVIHHPVWSLIGCLGFTGLYKLDRWEGLICGCILAVYVAPVWAIYANSFWHCANPAVPFTLAMLFYLIPAFYSVWTTAYNFVPLGTYTREFTGLSIGWTMFFIFVDLHLFRNERQIAQYRSVNRFLSKFWRLSCFGNICLFLFVFASSAMAYRYNQWDPSTNNNNVVVGGVNNNLDLTNQQQLHYRDHVTAMIWMYHFGYDNEGWPSLQRTANLIDDIRADIVGLCETDASRLYMGNNDLAAWLAETLNMYVDYGPSTKKHTWGCMLLSRYPIISSEHHLLPSPYGELAPAISALVRIGRQSQLAVVVAHMGNDRDDLDRKLQTVYLSNLTANFVERGYPVVFLGYITSRPKTRDYHVFTNQGRLKDIDPDDNDRFCEYIFYQNLIRLAYARISKGMLSDTEIQTAKFRLPEKSRDPSSCQSKSPSRDDSEKSRDSPENECDWSKAGNTFYYKDNRFVGTDPTKINEKGQLYSSTSFGHFRIGHYAGDDHRFHMSTPKYFSRYPVDQ